MHASPSRSFVTHAASRTLTVNQPSLAATSPYSLRSIRASSMRARLPPHLRLVPPTREASIHDDRRMMGRRLALAALLTTLALPAAAHAAFFTKEAGAPYGVGNAPYGVVARDFDGDGLIDVATVNGTSS